MQSKKNNNKTSTPVRQIVLRGRTFTVNEIRQIARITKRFSKDGRTRISEEVCRALDWKQANGWLKDRACRDALRRLHELGVIRLPPSRVDVGASNRKRAKSNRTISARVLAPVLALFEPIELEIAKGNSREGDWNDLIRSYHYLGHTVVVGRCMKFLVRSGATILGAASLSDSAWALASRDKILSRLGFSRQDVANNSRFLILPNVKVKNLASRVLSLLATRGVEEWGKYYGVKIKCLETFVDVTKFAGTSYVAANWLRVGSTRGFRKNGAAHANSQTEKTVFLYPLAPKSREHLTDLLRESVPRLK